MKLGVTCAIRGVDNDFLICFALATVTGHEMAIKILFYEGNNHPLHDVIVLFM